MSMDVHTKRNLGKQATDAATAELKKLHADEFQQLYEKHRLALGLPRRPDMESADDLRAKLEKARLREQQLTERLAEAEAAERPARRTTKAR